MSTGLTWSEMVEDFFVSWIWTSEIGTELSSANSLVDISEDVLNRRNIAAMWREEEWRQISQQLSGILQPAASSQQPGASSLYACMVMHLCQM